MNYLAHLYFSDPTPLAWAGSLMGDFVKGAVPTTFPEQLSRHIKLHRHIDSLTQTSEIFQTSRRRLDSRFRHGRSVLVDVFYDHFLACRWSEYSDQPLADFAQNIYAGLQSCYDFLSPGLQKQLPRMIEHDWLTAYRKPEIVQRVLQRLEERIQHKIPLAAGYSQLDLWRDALESDFVAFMVEAEQATTAWKQLN
ncbi:MAG: ACP phosphodiesterase [Desulfuromusa sp.]